MKYFKDILSKLTSGQRDKSMPPQVGTGEQKYVINHKGQPITKPKTYKQIVQDYGKVQNLEKDPAIRIVPHKPKSTPKPPPLPKLTKPMGKSELQISIYDNGNIDLEVGESVPQSTFDLIAESLEKKKKSFQFKAKHKSKKGGLTEAGRKAYNKATGSKLKRPQPGGGKRKKSFCARSKGQMKMHNISCSKTPDKRVCLARRRWACKSEGTLYFESLAKAKIYDFSSKKLLADLPTPSTETKKSEDYFNELLEKSLKTKLATAALGSLLVSAPISQEKQQAFKPKESQVKLHPDLVHISGIESNYGRNKHHKKVLTGVNIGHTAAGATGLMPITIKETVKKDKHLADRYPQTVSMNHDQLTDFINKNPEIENEIANSHYKKLLKIFSNNKNRAAYAWRNGINAAKTRSDSEILNDPYIKAVNRVKKTETYFQSLAKSFNLSKAKKFIAVTPRGMLSDGTYNPGQLFYDGNGRHNILPYKALSFNSIEEGRKHISDAWKALSDKDPEYKKSAPHPFDMIFIEDTRPGKWNEEENYYEDENGNPILNEEGHPIHAKIPFMEVNEPGTIEIDIKDPQNHSEVSKKRKLASGLKEQGKNVNINYPKMPEQKVKRQTYQEAMGEIDREIDIEEKKAQGYNDDEISEIQDEANKKTTKIPLAASEKYFQNLKKGSRQRKMPADPNKESQMNAMLIDEWQTKQYTPTRGLIKPLTGNLRDRALHRLSGLTKVRRSKDGKREFLLYRGVSDSEKNSVLDDKSMNYPKDVNTSWSPHQGIASRFANKRMGHILGSWIHEDNIHHFPKMAGNVYERHKGKKIKSSNDYSGENEIIVRHSRPNEGYVTHSFSDKTGKLEFNLDSPFKNEIKNTSKLAASEKTFNSFKKSNHLKHYFAQKLKKIDGVTATTMPVVSPSQTRPSLNGTSLKEQPRGTKGNTSPASQVSQSFQNSLGMPAVKDTAIKITGFFGKKENK